MKVPNAFLETVGRVEALDDLVGSSVLSLLKATGPSLAAQAAPHHEDLVAGLVKKIMALESNNAALTEQLQGLQQEQHKHEQDPQPHSSQPQQLMLPQQQPGGCACRQRHETQQVQHLQLELQRLRQQCSVAWQQVAEMKKFLNDYGLVWVGQPMQLEVGQEPSSPACGAGAQPSSHVGSRSSSPAMVAVPPAAAAAAAAPDVCMAAVQLPFELSELQECLDELSQLAGDGIGQLKQLGCTPSRLDASPNSSSSSSSKGKAMQLVIPEPVKLAVFSDGLVLHQCPPLPYSSDAADGILSDIYDGYFPSALRSEFPDGIPIHLVDRSHQTLTEATTIAATAAGKKGSNIIGWQDLEQQVQGLPALAAVSGLALLARLPKSVVRNQQVISVRPAIEQFIYGSSSSSSSSSSRRSSSSSGAAGKVYIRPSSCSGALSRPASQGTDAAAAAAAAAAGHQSSSARVGTAAQQQQATIQVKSEDGKQTYVVMLPYTANIATLRASIDKHRASLDTTCHICQQQPRLKQQQVASGAALGLGDSSQTGSSHVECNPASNIAGVCCGYELRSAFPARLYADGGMTLQQADLVPSATLFMRHAHTAA